MIAAWFAAIVLPLFATTIGGSVRVGTDPIATAFAAAIWGVFGSTIGALSVTARTRIEGVRSMDVVGSEAGT
jgi:hypothetical protein